MRSAASLAFAALIGLSLAGKLLANQAPPDPDRRAFDTSARSMLEAAGLATRSDARRFGTLLSGSSGGCRLILGEYDPHGTFAELFRHLAAPVGPLRFAWRGRVYARAPKTAGLAGFYVWRELRRVGVAAPRAPIAAWAASPGCDSARLDWSRLARLPA